LTTMKYDDRYISDAGFESTRVLKVDSKRLQDFFEVEVNWFWRSNPNQIVDGTRISTCNQVIELVGAHPDDPFSLAGEMTVWIDGKKNQINKNSLIFVPADVPFGPVQINHMEHPICLASIGIVPNPGQVRDPSLPRFTIISQTKPKAVQPKMPVKRTLKAANILHMEDDMVKDSFYVNSNWFYEGYGQAPNDVHEHEWPELIAMIGCDPEHPHDLGGVFTVDMDGETHYITKSTLVCIPAHVKHCPWKFLDIRKPTLTITASPSGLYYSSEKNRW
jgi:hypothetical protein